MECQGKKGDLMPWCQLRHWRLFQQRWSHRAAMKARKTWRYLSYETPSVIFIQHPREQKPSRSSAYQLPKEVPLHCGLGVRARILQSTIHSFNSCRPEFVLRNMKHLCIFYHFSTQRCIGRWGLPSRKTQTHVLCIVNSFDTCNGLLPDGTKPLPEPMLTYHH